MGKKTTTLMFKDREDDFTGIFPNVSKVVNFCDKKYNKKEKNNKGVYSIPNGRGIWNIFNRNNGNLLGDVVTIRLLNKVRK